MLQLSRWRACFRTFPRAAKRRPVSRRRCQVEELESRTLLASGLGSLGSASPGQLVGGLYEQTLGRFPSADELASGIGALGAGQGLTQLQSQLENGLEYQTNQIADAYWTLLGHSPDPPSIDSWRGQLQAGVPFSQLRVALVASDEYYQVQGSPATWVSAAYTDLVGRAATDADLGPFLQSLQDGADRASVAASIAQGAAPASVGTAALWDPTVDATAPDTLLVQIASVLPGAIERLQPAAAAEGATVTATEIPGLYALQADRSSLLRLVDRFASVPYVQYAEPERTEQMALTPNDPKFTDGTLYGLNGTNGIGAPAAWNQTTGSPYVTVANIDTGIDYNHADLYENVWINQAEIPSIPFTTAFDNANGLPLGSSRKSLLTDLDGDNQINFYDLNDPRSQGPGKITDINGDGRIDAADILAPMTTTTAAQTGQSASLYDTGAGGWAYTGNTQDGDTAHPNDFVGWNFVNNTNDPFDDNGHGTQTAGVIGALGNDGAGVVGVAWTVQIMPLKVLDSTGSGTDVNAAAAINYAANHGARVSNNSWGSAGTDTTVANAISYANTKGDVFVTAAGNNGANDDTTFYSPASNNLANMLSVAATDSNGQLASFSNYGATTVALGAPGVNIYSTLPGNSYGSASGTSMAAPYVTGTVALILSQHPTWTVAQIVNQVKNNTTADANLAGKTATGGLDNAAGVVDPNLWNGYGRDSQHTGLSTAASQPLQYIRWQTPVDLNPQYSGNDLYIHYGSPQITQANTVIVPVKTGATSGFEFEGIDGGSGTVKWTQTTNYVLPPHNWVPSYSPTLTSSGKVYYAGKGGAIYILNSPDSNAPTVTGPIYFYGQGLYNSSPTAFDAGMFIDTPITADAQGNIYFGYRVVSGFGINVESGIARISAAGVGTWQPARVAAGDSSITQVVMNCAPALSNDGSKLYEAVSNGNFGAGYLVEVDSTTLNPVAKVHLKDPATNNNADLPDDGTSSPTVGPDGDVYFGVLENPFPNNHDRGWLLHFSGDLSVQKPTGAFGWDDTATIVPASLVPSYTGTSSYLLMTKYNNYASISGGNGHNRVAILDPNATQLEPETGYPNQPVMKEILTILGPTPDPSYDVTYPGAVHEWCINNAVVDPFTKCVLVNSEDGILYRWDLTTNTFTQQVTLTAGIGEAYTPTIVGKDGTVYAVNNAKLFAVGFNNAHGTASFASTNTTTQGNWQGTYGGLGYNILGDVTAEPGYAQVNAGSTAICTWAASTSDPRCLQKASNPATRVAACWYGSTFTIDLNFTDSAVHRVAMYLLDWDSTGRSERIDVVDVTSNNVLDTRTVSNFAAGQYVSWNLSGHVQLRVTALAGPNAVASGLFVGPAGAPASSGTAAFLSTDTTTQGTWQGNYGGDGDNVLGDTSAYPSYAQVNAGSTALCTWAGTTSDPRALRKASNPSDHVAATFYGSTFTIDLNFTDGATHRLALYLLDWDSSGRSERIDVVDVASYSVLDSRTVSNFAGGEYVIWNLSGHVQLRVTALAGPNAVVSGLFFGPAGAPASTGSATFLTTDTTAQGTWQGVYGGDGDNVLGDTTAYPSYAQVNAGNTAACTWATSTSDPRALRKASNPTDHVAACFYGSTFTIDLNFTNSNTHRLALYLLDWDSSGRSERIDILDAASSAVLDTRTVSNFASGEYLVWNLTGHVQLRFTTLAGPNAVLNGLFFGPAGTPASSGSATFLTTDTTTQGTWQGTYGSNGYNVLGDTTSYPSYAQVNAGSTATWTWAGSTSDPRALQKASNPSSHVAACWYGSTFTIDLNLTDSNTHRLALYLLDWDSSGRSERIDILDAGSNAVLDSRTVSSFSSGTYLSWNLTGHVQLRFTTLAGPNAVVSGLFFG
jgi:subtilisin family serine protease